MMGAYTEAVCLVLVIKCDVERQCLVMPGELFKESFILHDSSVMIKAYSLSSHLDVRMNAKLNVVVSLYYDHAWLETKQRLLVFTI